MFEYIGMKIGLSDAFHGIPCLAQLLIGTNLHKIITINLGQTDLFRPMFMTSVLKFMILSGKPEKLERQFFTKRVEGSTWTGKFRLIDENVHFCRQYNENFPIN